MPPTEHDASHGHFPRATQGIPLTPAASEAQGIDDSDDEQPLAKLANQRQRSQGDQSKFQEESAAGPLGPLDQYEAEDTEEAIRQSLAGNRSATDVAPSIHPNTRQLTATRRTGNTRKRTGQPQYVAKQVFKRLWENRGPT